MPYSKICSEMVQSSSWFSFLIDITTEPLSGLPFRALVLPGYHNKYKIPQPPPPQRPFQFPEPGKVLVGKIDCDSQGRYAHCKQEFGLQFGSVPIQWCTIFQPKVGLYVV